MPGRRGAVCLRTHRMTMIDQDERVFHLSRRQSRRSVASSAVNEASRVAEPLSRLVQVRLCAFTVRRSATCIRALYITTLRTNGFEMQVKRIRNSLLTNLKL